MPVLVNHIAKRNCSAIVHAFQRVFGHATHDLFRQVSRVILRISFQNGFQNDTLRASRNGFCCRHQLHTIAFQLGLVPCAIVAVPGKAVKFPDDDNIKDSPLTVLDHLLELWAVIGLGGDGTVNVMLHHREAVLFRIGGCLLYTSRCVEETDAAPHLENRMTVCMGYTAMTLRRRAGKRRRKGGRKSMQGERLNVDSPVTRKQCGQIDHIVFP